MEVSGSTHPPPGGPTPTRVFPCCAATSQAVEGVDTKCTWYNPLTAQRLVDPANVADTTHVRAEDMALMAMQPSCLHKGLSSLADLLQGVDLSFEPPAAMPPVAVIPANLLWLPCLLNDARR